MLRTLLSACLGAFLLLASVPAACAPQMTGKGKLTEVRLEGLKALAQEPILSATGLHLGDLVSRADLQAAADRLLHTGLFSKVAYEFHSQGESLSVVYHLEEAPRVPVLFDNIPWFADTELIEAMRKTMPTFDGAAPQEGPVVDQIGDALAALLKARGLQLTVEHELLANPSADGSVLRFHVQGASIKVSRIEFGDALAAQSPALQQSVDAVVGKAYSRMALELFLFEHVRPLYWERGYLRVQIGPPEVRLSGDPAQAFLSGSIAVFVPIQPGSVYRWSGARWAGNQALTSAELDALLGLKLDAPADGQELLAGWEKVSDEYAHHGYLDAKIDPQPTYDAATATVSYQVRVIEGPQYHYGEMVITGLSLTDERSVRDAWTLPRGSVFDRSRFEELLALLDKRSPEIFGKAPVHYEEVGHWLRMNPETRVVDVLLDFK
jgi:outer membrane protein assembly factor BamA